MGWNAVTTGSGLQPLQTLSEAQAGVSVGGPKLTAVIVTYNNPEMLATLLTDLGRQSLPLHETIVIDNSDSDSTRVMVGRQFQSITYIKMPKNVGTAGGFHQGLRKALRDCEFVLTLDDDVRLREDAVHELYQGYQYLKKDNPRLGAVRAVGARHGHSAPCRLADLAWRGTLFNAEAIRRTGLPLPEYFMYADDVEFSIRLAEHGYEAFDIPRSKIMEQRIWDKLSQQILGRKVTCYAEDFRYYYALRNSIHAFRKHGRRRALMRTIAYALKMIIFFTLFHRSERWHRVRAIVHGVNDGIRSRLGKNRRFLPEVGEQLQP